MMFSVTVNNMVQSNQILISPPITKDAFIHNLPIFISSAVLFSKCLLKEVSSPKFWVSNFLQVQHIVPKDIIETVCLLGLLLCNILNSALNSSCLSLNIFFIIPPFKQTITLKVIKYSWQLLFN
jgi:hypothetical protein